MPRFDDKLMHMTKADLREVPDFDYPDRIQLNGSCPTCPVCERRNAIFRTSSGYTQTSVSRRYVFSIHVCRDCGHVVKVLDFSEAL